MKQKIRSDNMKKTFLANSISASKGWEICFHYIMEKSDTFRIIFQGSKDVLESDEFLNAGKREFLSLPALTISPYGGMENSIRVTGKLDQAARGLFLTFMSPAFEGYKPDLWSFEFLKGNDVKLSVGDFTDYLLFLEESEVEELLAQGVNIDGTDLEEIDCSCAAASQPEQLDAEEMKMLFSSLSNHLQSLADQLQKKFLANHESLPEPPEGDL
jgi:hypothetical protein